MDEVILGVVTLDGIKFVAFCYICLLCHIYSLLALCFVFLSLKGVLVFQLCAMDEVLDDLYVLIL